VNECQLGKKKQNTTREGNLKSEDVRQGNERATDKTRVPRRSLGYRRVESEDAFERGER